MRFCSLRTAPLTRLRDISCDKIPGNMQGSSHHIAVKCTVYKLYLNKNKVDKNHGNS